MHPTRALFAVTCLFLVASPAAQGRKPGLFAEHEAARNSGRFAMLLKQFRADEPGLPGHQEAGWKEATPTYQNARDIPAGHWVWRKPYWFVFRDGPDHQPKDRSWGPEAACGEPDTPQPGDHGTAWATRQQDGKGEWLLLEYGSPVRATAIEIHETHNPGAIASIAILKTNGEELELWSNRDIKAAKAKGRVLQIDLPLGFEVERIKLYLASEAVAGWNEIDAVGLEDDKGKVHWASRAEASSTYADADRQRAAPRAALLQRRVFLQPAIQPLNLQVQLPRVVLQAPRLQFQAAQAFQPLRVGRLAPAGDDDEKQKLHARIAELEAQVEKLQAELARAKGKRTP